MIKKKTNKKLLKIRKKIKSFNLGKLRISINRSKRNISAQIIDDMKSTTLVMATSLDKSLRAQKIEKKQKLVAVAESPAKKANEKKLKNFYFDRGTYRYHGRIKIFADTLRKNGIKI